jgi:hypothetical protein
MCAAALSYQVISLLGALNAERREESILSPTCSLGSSEEELTERKKKKCWLVLTLDGRSEALSSANLEGDLRDAGADSACSSGIRCFPMGAGAEGGVTDAGSAGCCRGLVRQRRVGVEGLLLLLLPPPVAALLTAEKNPPPAEKNPPPAPAVGVCCGRRFLFLASRWPSPPSSHWTDVHSALRHPVPILLLSLLDWSRREETGEEEEEEAGRKVASCNWPAAAGGSLNRYALLLLVLLIICRGRRSITWQWHGKGIPGAKGSALSLSVTATQSVGCPVLD